MLLSYLHRDVLITSIPSGVHTKSFTRFASRPCMLHTPSDLIFLYLIILKYLVKSANYGEPHIAVFSASCHFISLRSKCFPQHPPRNVLNMCCSLNMTLRTLHPSNTTGKTTICRGYCLLDSVKFPCSISTSCLAYV
jgi:hypothetical protein